MTARHENGCYEEQIFTYCFGREGISNDYVGGARGTVVQEIRPGAGFKAGDFAKEKLGGLPQNDIRAVVLHIKHHTTPWKSIFLTLA